jgi:hypothetical protein
MSALRFLLLGMGRRGTAGGGGADDFSTVFGSRLKGWWDVSDAGNRTVVGSDVTALADKSGTGNGLVVDTGTMAYDATGMAGNPKLAFAGGRFKTSTASMVGNSRSFGFFAVCTLATGAAANAALMSFLGSGETYSYAGTTSVIGIVKNSTNAEVEAYWDGALSIKSLSYDSIVRIAAVADGGTDLLTTYVNGVAATAASITGKGPLAALGTFYLGGDPQITPWTGDFGEGAFVVGAITSGEVASIDAALATKWS